MTRSIALLLVLSLAPASYAGAQQASSGRTADAAPPAVSYTIGPQDQLMITIFNEDDLTNRYRVDEEGMITFPLIGRVAAAGSTLSEFQSRLQERLSAGYIRNPQVRVEIDQYKSQSVYVTGEVRSPGKIPMTGLTITVLEALAAAGSPTVSASSELIVVHPKKKGGAATIPGQGDAGQQRINIKDLQTGKAGQDIVLQDGDTIFVPKAQIIYITGQVRNPGSYVFEPGMTVLQALSLAGGLSERGSDRGIRIERIVNGRRLTIEARTTDPVLADDTIQIRTRFF